MKRRRHVHLQQPGFEVRVDENIETINLKTIVSVRNKHLASTIDWKFYRDNALDDDILDRFHQVCCIDVIGS